MMGEQLTGELTLRRLFYSQTCCAWHYVTLGDASESVHVVCVCCFANLFGFGCRFVLCRIVECVYKCVFENASLDKVWARAHANWVGPT